MFTRQLKLALFLSLSWLAHAGAQAGEIALYSREGLEGRELRLRDGVNNLIQLGFNDRAESMVIYSGRWEICEHVDFGGQCRVFEPGEYPTLRRFGDTISSLREVRERGGRDDHRDDRRDDGAVILFNQPHLRGHSMPLDGTVGNLTERRFNDQAQSILVRRGHWEVCVHADFRGQCRVLGPGQYNNLDRTFDRSISSVRPAGRGGRDRDHDRDHDRDRRDAIELFEDVGFGGKRVPMSMEIRNLQVLRFNDSASSLIVHDGQWEFCEHADFRGHCSTYGPGRYDRLGRLQDQISSFRRVR